MSKFLAFADSITIKDGVGGDTAEDVFGGLEAVTKLSWREIGTKVKTGKYFYIYCIGT